MFRSTIRVAQWQRVLWYRDGNLMGVLRPGRHVFWRRVRHLRLESFDISEGLAELANAAYLARAHSDMLREHLDLYEIGEKQAGFVFVNHQLTRLALPGEVVALWKESVDTAIEIVEVDADLAVADRWVRAINRSGATVSLERLSKALYPVAVDQGHEAIVIVDGQINRTLGPGRYAFWKLGHEIVALSVDKRIQEIEINGQEILTRDRVSLRVNASLHFRINDATRAVVDLPDVHGLAYRAVQFALRRTIGALLLDELLVDKSKLGEDVLADVARSLADAGVAVSMVGIKDIILPGEMKTILNRVVEAEKLAEANAIRRRDETQSVRALANTARQLEGNAMMARLKELEALQSVVSSIGTLNVYNGLDGMMDQLVRLKG